MRFSSFLARRLIVASCYLLSDESYLILFWRGQHIKKLNITQFGINVVKTEDEKTAV